MNKHDNVNQKILGDFVEREVKACVSSMIDALQEANEYWFENWDIANLYQIKCPECGCELKQKEGTSNATGEEVEIWVCEFCSYNTTDEPESEMQEPYEYWIVTDWLASKLEEKGEVIIREFGNSIWGRTCTGQAILLDGVIGNIAEDLEILDGQRYSWAK